MIYNLDMQVQKFQLISTSVVFGYWFRRFATLGALIFTVVLGASFDVACASASGPHHDIKPNSVFFPYTASLSPRLGYGYSVNPDKDQFWLVGIAYQLKSESIPRDEFMLDFRSQRDGIFTYAKKWMRHPTEPNRWSIKAGASLWFKTDDGLTNVINYEHYQIFGGIGYETWLISNTSLRFDLEAAAGLKNQYAQVIAGYAWSW